MNFLSLCRMGAIPPHIVNDLAAVQVLISENVGYDLETDSTLAVTMAKRVVEGCRILRIRRPMTMSQGGYGRGSGFSQEYDPQALDDMEKRATAFLASHGEIASGVPDGMFGFFEGDARQFSHKFGE